MKEIQLFIAWPYKLNEGTNEMLRKLFRVGQGATEGYVICSIVYLWMKLYRMLVMMLNVLGML